MSALDGVNLHLVETTQDAMNFIHWLNNRRDVLACDTETGGLEFWQKDLRLVQFGDLESAWAIPYQQWRGVVEEALNTYEGELCFHNAPFDVKFLEKHADVKLDWTKIHDTLIMSHLDDPGGRHGLKHLGVKHVDRNAAVGDKLLKKAMSEQGWGWNDIPVDFQPYWAYGAMDTIITAHLFDKYKTDCIGGRFNDAYDLEITVLEVLTNMEARGARIDLPYCDMQYKRLGDYVDQTIAWCAEHYGVSAGSNQAVARRLIEDGVELTKKTKTGHFALDVDVLESIQGHPLADAVLGQRKARKIRSTYFENFLNMHNNGVIHCSINSMGARTGRMSVRNPALQTLPRGSIVRNAFIPKEGNQLAAIDYQAIEMRVFAHFAKEERMIEAIEQGVDLHSFTAQLAFGLGDEMPTAEQRTIAKAAGFSKIYGAGTKKFSWTAGIPESEGRNFMDGYARAFPGVERFMKDVERAAKARLRSEGVAYVQNPSGRWHPTEENKIYTLVNYLVQSEAAEVLKRALVALSANGFDEYLVVPVHDEVIFDFPGDMAEELMREAAMIMTDDTNYAVTMLAEAEGPFNRWGEKYDK